MNTISNILYWISSGLLVPVIVLLIFYFLRSLVLIGTFFSDYLRQKKVDSKIFKNAGDLTPDSIAEFAENLPEKSAGIAIDYAKLIIRNSDNRAKVDLLLSEYEIAADKDISSSKVLTKMGPILGLMGTLIPMGPALVGLAQGDISSMAYNMMVAFATTVVGLTASAIGFLTQQVKERWAVKNISILEYIADTASARNNPDYKSSNPTAE